MKFLNSIKNKILGVATPISAAIALLAAPTNFKEVPSSLKENFSADILPCLIMEEPDSDRLYDSGEIERIIHEAYVCTKNKPDYMTEEFVKTLADVESRFNPYAIGYRLRKSSNGRFFHLRDRRGKKIPTAKGLLQITKGAWDIGGRELNYLAQYEQDVFNPRVNADVGIGYMLFLDKYIQTNHPEFKSLNEREKRRILSAAYNGGVDRLAERDWLIGKMYAETRDYVKKISNRLEDD